MMKFKKKFGTAFVFAADEFYIKGELECRKNGVLFLSVPYSEGWKLYLNGVERKIQKANIGFLASEIVQGEYELELRYHNYTTKQGLELPQPLIDNMKFYKDK